MRVVAADPRLRARIERALVSQPSAGVIVTGELRGLAALRAANPQAPVVIVEIRRTQVADALDAGADVALAGALRPAELRARVRLLARAQERRWSVGPLVLDRAARSATLDGVALELPPRELSLLCVLACAPGRTFTKQELLRSCWGDVVRSPGSRSLERQAARLRGRLGRHAAMLVTVWGVGYRLDVPA